MNQQPMSQMENPKPPIASWLWITLIVVIILAGGFLAWWFLMGPGKTTTTTTTPAATTVPDKTLTNTTYGYSFTYPSTATAVGTTGQESATATVETASNVIIYPKGVANTTGNEIFKVSLFNYDVNVAKDITDHLGTVTGTVTTSTIAGKSGFKYVDTKDTVTLYFVKNADSKTIEIAVKNSNSDASAMFTSFKFTTASTSTTTSTSDLTYTNSKYGFTMLFPTSWKGYKFKEANFTGSTTTYYAEIPTTDKTYSASSTADAGYYSPFAITVYTLPQWETAQNEEGPDSTLIIKDSTYAYAWSQANGMPPSDIGTKLDDIKTIIASFKLK